jgi:parvulin-like peptidyl-prolyl isomerase
VIRKIFQDFVGAERERRVDEAEQRLVKDLIDRRLLYQVAKKEGMLPSKAEVDAALEELRRNNNAADEAQFRALLKAEGVTMEQVRRTVSERIAIGRLLARQIQSAIILSEDIAKLPEPQTSFEEFRKPSISPVAGADKDKRRSGGGSKRRHESAMRLRRDDKQYATTLGRGRSLTVHRGELAPEIEAAAFNLPGGVSEPLRLRWVFI